VVTVSQGKMTKQQPCGLRALFELDGMALCQAHWSRELARRDLERRNYVGDDARAARTPPAAPAQQLKLI
jgi:hypothetical protein